MRKTILLFFIGLMGTFSLYAQQKVITGKVTNQLDGSSIPNVTVQVEQTNRVTQTDVDGAFSVQAAEGEVLLFNAVGFTVSRVVVGTSNSVGVNLSPSEDAIEEVVVTALGIQKEKRSLGYAVQDIKADELMKNKNPNLINSLNGKIAGLNITNSGGSPGASASIIIRGGTSLERDNQPLFVIDGMPMDNSTGQGDLSAFDGNTNISSPNSNRAMDINPEDVESISVLKGPTAAALYGIRAAAGAIVITTKRGAAGSTTIGVNSRLSANWVNRLPKQQKTYRQGSNYNDNYTEETYWSWGEKFDQGEQVYDNLGDFFETGMTYDNSFNISGGSENGNFFLSGSNLSQSGIVPTTDFDRTTFRFNGEQKVGVFTFGANTSYSSSATRKTLTGSGLWGGGGNGYMESIIAWPLNRNMKDWRNEDGSNRLMFPNLPLENNIDNPYWIINMNPQDDKTNRFLGSIYSSAKVTDWLDVNYRLGVDNYSSNYTSQIHPGSSVKEDWQQGMLSQSVKQYNYINSNLMLNFHKVVAEDWDLNFLLGTATEDISTKVTGNRAENFIIPGFISLNNSAPEDKYSYSNDINVRRVGVFGDARVGYKDIVYLGATLRNDWSSTLPKKNQSFMYPSFSGSFVFTELLENSNILSYGKVRSSWAEVGKDAPAYQTNTYLFGPELTVGGGFRDHWTSGNPDLKPEKTQSFEVGTDLRFLNSRLGLEFTYYENKSVDQILSPRVDNATGYILKYVNAGTLVNKGVEFTVTGNPIRRDNFSWDVMLNLSHNKGTVKDLPGDIEILYVTDVQVANGKAASYENGDFMAISGSKWNSDEHGNTILNWETGLPTNSALATLQVGNREPKFIGGLNNSFTYKDWNLSFLLDFRKGGDVLNGTEYLLTQYGLSTQTENRGNTVQLSGVALNPSTNEYEAVTREVLADQKFYQDYYVNHIPHFVETVNWLRLRSVSLSYSLPQSVLKSSKVFKGATFNLMGNNLLLLTNYSGMDPEISAAGAGVVGSGSVGVDYAGVPNTAGFTFGVNLKF